MYRIFITCIIAITCIAASAQSDPEAPPSGAMRKVLSDSVSARLSVAKSPSDSLRLLCDLFDLAPMSHKFSRGMNAYRQASRMGRDTDRLAILRQMSVCIQDNDSLAAILLNEVAKVPKSDEQQTSELFLRMFITNMKARTSSESERQRQLTEIVKEHAELDKNPVSSYDGLYERLYRINAICAYLAQMSKGELLTSYLEQYGRLIRRLPKRLENIDQMYYSRLAETYSYIGEKKKSVEADRMLIRSLQRSRSNAVRQGRKFRNHNLNIYRSYRRMLGNYECLTPEEVEEYYQKCQELAKNDPDVGAEFYHIGLTRIYYLMATKQYGKAIETMLKKRAETKNVKHPIQLLRMLILAAKVTGNDDVLRDAALEYISALEEYVESRSHERYSELQVMYDINQLKDANAELKESQNMAASTYHRNIIIVGGISIVLLLLLVICLIVMYRRAMRLSTHLADTNTKLTAESENLRRTQRDLIAARDRANSADNLKTEFINNMSHEVEAPLSAIVEYSQLIVDTVAEDKREYLTKFASIVTLSADLLQTLVNDVLTVNSIDSGQLSIKRMMVSAKELCSIAVETEAKQAAPGVKVIFENADDKEPCIITTDSLRVEQVLLNLVNNGVKFTPKGSVSLRYDFNHDRSRITFTVTDTGPGISDNEAGKIFERFYKGDNYQQGVGLGLPICRLIAKLLGGEVKFDPTYTGGARFIFTIPTA